MTRTLRPTLTPVRRRWLERVELIGTTYPIASSNDDAGCIQLGWAQWADKRRPWLGARITDAGRRVLAEAREREARDD